MRDVQRTVLILGGTSDIGRATALAYAGRGWTVQLAGRNEEALRLDADNIAIRSGATVTVHRLDVLETSSFGVFADALPTLPDTVVCVVGMLGDQRRAESDLEHATLVMRSNYEGPALILGLLAERFVKRGSGTIVGVSSVAGDRGRASNYVYGSAKAGLTAFLSGLRNRCAKHGVHDHHARRSGGRHHRGGRTKARRRLSQPAVGAGHGSDRPYSRTGVQEDVHLNEFLLWG